MLVWTAAAAPAGTGDETTVRVYTNADLERFGPRAEPCPGPPVDDSAERRFVADFIEREYARIAEDKRLSLERELLDRRSEPPAPRWVAPWFGVYGHRWIGFEHAWHAWDGRRAVRNPHRHTERPRDSWIRRPAGPFRSGGRR